MGVVTMLGSSLVILLSLLTISADLGSTQDSSAWLCEEALEVSILLNIIIEEEEKIINEEETTILDSVEGSDNKCLPYWKRFKCFSYGLREVIKIWITCKTDIACWEKGLKKLIEDLDRKNCLPDCKKYICGKIKGMLKNRFPKDIVDL